MPLVNYTTRVPVDTTIGQIQRRLVKNGASAILVDYEDGKPVALSFKVNTKRGVVAYRLPCNVSGVYAALDADPEVPPHLVKQAQAERVAWRVLQHWVEAQLAIIEARMATLDEVMLPYALLEDGQTAYERFVAGGPPALGR